MNTYKSFYDYCVESNKKNLLDEWDFEKNEILPTDINYNSSGTIWFKCRKGHSYKTTLRHRTLNNTDCPICAGKLVVEGINDFASKYPDIAEEWHPTKNGELKPTDITANSNKKVWWICENGHEWETVVSYRTKGCHCPICAGKKTLDGFNDIATTHPELARQWHPTKNGASKPTDVTSGSGKKVWWICESGHEWEATIVSRVQGAGCPYCSNRRTLIGYNDLATTHPEIAKEWHSTKNGELKPTDVTAGSNKKVWWICEKGHEWITTVSNRSRYGSTCPFCKKEWQR